MTRSLFPLTLLLSLISIATLAQTAEPMHYAVTQPANVSLTLDGTLTLPANMTKPVPVILLIAGSGPTDRDCNSALGLKSDAFKMLADSLNRMGVAVARYDKRGSGTNRMIVMATIKQSDIRFDHYVSDAVGFIRQLQADKRFSKVIVAGHSEGSLVGMLAAEQTKANGYVSIAGMGRNAAEVMKDQNRLGTSDPQLLSVIDTAIDSLRNGFIIHPANPELRKGMPLSIQPYIISTMRYDPAQIVKTYVGPVLIIQGRKDFQVSVKDAELLKAARPDATLLLFDTMNHVLKNFSGTDVAENMKTYGDPTLPLTPGLATAIARFAKR